MNCTFLEFYMWDGGIEITDRIPVVYPRIPGLKNKRCALALQVGLPLSTTHFRFLEIVEGKEIIEIEPEVFWLQGRWGDYARTIIDRFGRIHEAKGRDYFIPDSEEG